MIERGTQSCSSAEGRWLACVCQHVQYCFQDTSAMGLNMIQIMPLILCIRSVVLKLFVRGPHKIHLPSLATPHTFWQDIIGLNSVSSWMMRLLAETILVFIIHPDVENTISDRLYSMSKPNMLMHRAARSFRDPQKTFGDPTWGPDP